MKKLIFIAALIVVSAITTVAQSADEKELLKFIADYDQAYVKKDIAFMENNFAEDYYLIVDGDGKNRVELLAEARQKFAEPKTKTLDLKSTNETVRVVGSIGVAKGIIDWKEAPAGDLKAEPNTGKERYTLVWEKRGGKWLLISEHVSTVQRDRKMMEAEVIKASQTYAEIVKRGDYDALERFVTEDTIFTNESGKTRNKAETMTYYRSRDYKIDLLEITDQKVRVTGDRSAVETGTVRYKITSKNGKPSEGYERYTTTWMRRDGRWQILADHVSDIKQ